MNIINQSYRIIDSFSGSDILKYIESIGRVCYKSEALISDSTSKNFVKSIILNGHESVIEHFKISVQFVCDRGISHEIVRHRIASYSQESTRYCNYASDKFGNELTFIKPYFWEENSEWFNVWFKTMQIIEENYIEMVKNGVKPQEARAILPNSLKTEIVVTMNLREWRHFFKLRCSKNAHPQMRELVIPLLIEFKSRIPIIFDDINFD
ncbi:MAG: thymidylate synthase, flavin-dependent [Clostridiales bacterium 38-18]|nr:MAG: thymidylate synthase, flavin-dependent [Clostridiales bacterium 38-18]